MRKIIISLSLVLGIMFVANAQELVSKKGFKILPEAGDIALGFNAVPVIDFALNAANIMVNTGQTAAHPSYVSGFAQTIVGKYYLEDNKALRGYLAINRVTTTNKDYFFDPKDAAKPIAEQGELIDITKTTVGNFSLGSGLEFRRGHNRLQGFYGGELGFGFGTTGAGNVKTSYGVDMTQDAITNGYTNADGSPLSGRVLKDNTQTVIALGVRGFIGVEYFFAPKISVAAEFGWGVGTMGALARGKQVVENWDGAKSAVEEVTLKGDVAKGWKMEIDNGMNRAIPPIGGSAALTMLFHF